MRKFTISMMLLLAVSSAALAADIELQNDRPDRYIVVKGDTLWSIAGRFLKQPWRWPEVWRMNRTEIKNPNRIYPGDVVVLDMVNGSPQLRLLSSSTMSNSAGGRPTEKLDPTVRVSPLEKEAIPTIPLANIEPFLSQPLVVGKDHLAQNARIVATEEQRVVLGTGNRAYVRPVTEAQGRDWQVYHAGKALIDPDNNEILGYEAVYLGDAQITQFGDPSTLVITRGKQEIAKGDYLVPSSQDLRSAYVPHAPETAVQSRIISMYGGVAEVGRDSIITLSKGTRNGLEVGHVLALYRHGATIKATRSEPEIKLPDERYGLVMIFRVFESVSYALVMASDRPVIIGDVAKNPD